MSQVQLSGEYPVVQGLHVDAGSIYTPINQLKLGQPCEPLAQEVARFAGVPSEVLHRFSNQPLVLWRPVAAPNHEFFRYLSVARAIGSQPLVLETRQDWFTPSVNLSKRALVKLPIVVGNDRNGTPRTRSVKVAALSLPGKRRIAEVACFDGTTLVDFHHVLCRRLTGFDPLEGAMDARLLDGGLRPRAAYERAFALFTCLGVLAESFMWKDPEKAFTEDVVLPAFDATVRRFGARPRIVQLLPAGAEADPYWESYPAEVMPFARKAARRCMPS